jgi:Methylene-tetrahydrofolate reductase C terminal
VPSHPRERQMSVVAAIEHAVKEPLFGCRMCGQCVLHDTGMTCPMTCPKMLRNGPCGGVRDDGTCEVNPELRCVWVKAEERARTMRLLPGSWREQFHTLRPPVDNRLAGTSAWVNLVRGRDREQPPGWNGGAG